MGFFKFCKSIFERSFIIFICVGAYGSDNLQMLLLQNISKLFQHGPEKKYFLYFWNIVKWKFEMLLLL